MDKKSFSILIIILLITFIVTTTVKYYRPESDFIVDFSDFPLELDNWRGVEKEVPQYALDILNPMDVFSASYVNDDGLIVRLFFDYFSPDRGFGGPHSPRNCLPGAGWIIQENKTHNIDLGERTLSANRLKLKYQDDRYIMDFFYITHYGETGNDYLFKIYEIFSSLTFKPKDIAFIRFECSDTPENKEALIEFQKIFIKEVYKKLPFEI